MEGSTSPKNDVDKTKASQDSSQESLIGANWPSLPVPADSQRTFLDATQDTPIQPAQKSPTPWKGQQRGPADYERDMVEKYAKYFKGNEILPIPELEKKLTPRILSLVVSDLKTKRLVGLKKETFDELLRKAGIPCQYFCRKSFATWDVLLPTEDQAAKLAANNITTRCFRLQPEYRGTRRLNVTICNVPASFTGEVFAAYLSSYGQVEEYKLLRSPAGTAYGDYAFRMCLTRDGFKAIPEILISGDRQMIVMVEGRRPRCWSCKQIGHISKFCPEKPENAAAAATATTTTVSTATTTTTSSKTAEARDPSQGQPKTNDKEGWSEVTRKRRGSPKQGGKSLMVSPPQNQTKTPEPPAAVTTQEKAATPTTKKGPQTPTPKTTSSTPVSPTLAKKKKKKNKEDHESMETTTNLKRRRDSGEGAAKKVCAGPSSTDDPLEGPSNAYPQKQPLPQQVPMQAPLMAPLPPPPTLPLLPMVPPQHCIPQNAPPEPLQPPQYIQPPLPPPQSPQPPLPTETPPFQPQLKNFRRHQIVHTRRAQSLERPSPQKIARSLSLPSLSPISSPELFPERTPIPTNPQTTSSQHEKEAANSADTEKDQQLKAKHLCTVGAEAVTDHQLKKMLKPLLQLEKVDKKKVNNPFNFKGAAMVTTFIRSAGDRTKGVWKFLDTVRQTDTGVKLAELEHPSLKRCLPFCAGRVPIFVHPSFYRALKVRFPLDVGGVSRDGRVNTELGTGSLETGRWHPHPWGFPAHSRH